MRTVKIELDSGKVVTRSVPMPVESKTSGGNKTKPVVNITGADDYFDKLYARHQANRAKVMQRVASHRVAEQRSKRKKVPTRRDVYVANIDDDVMRHKVYKSLACGDFTLEEDPNTGEIFLKQAAVTPLARNGARLNPKHC